MTNEQLIEDLKEQNWDEDVVVFVPFQGSYKVESVFRELPPPCPTCGARNVGQGKGKIVINCEVPATSLGAGK